MSDIWETWGPRPGHQFIADNFCQIWLEGWTGEEYEDFVDAPDGSIADAALAAAAFAAAAIKADCARRRIDAWILLARAEYWLGIVVGVDSMKGNGDHAIRLLARRAAEVRHAEHREMRKQVWDWCGANIRQYRSMDAAAEAVAGKLVPVTFRTVRGWIGEWRKMQSARKP